VAEAGGLSAQVKVKTTLIYAEHSAGSRGRQ
jgi:hypothetical protein